jgi:hypothetical protein
MITDIFVGYSIVSGVMASLLLVLTLLFEKDKIRSRALLIFGTLFLASSFAASESAFWSEGYNLFDLVFGLNAPLIAYFGIWFAFVIWMFERRGERKIWIILMAALIITVIVAKSCMNCFTM